MRDLNNILNTLNSQIKRKQIILNMFYLCSQIMIQYRLYSEVHYYRWYVGV